MIAGVLIGLTVFPPKLLKANGIIQLVCTAVLIFSMGVSLGRRPDLFRELASVGWQSLVFSLVPVAFSVCAVYFITRKWPGDRHDRHGRR